MSPSSARERPGHQKQPSRSRQSVQEIAYDGLLRRTWWRTGASRQIWAKLCWRMFPAGKRRAPQGYTLPSGPMAICWLPAVQRDRAAAGPSEPPNPFWGNPSLLSSSARRRNWSSPACNPSGAVDPSSLGKTNRPRWNSTPSASQRWRTAPTSWTFCARTGIMTRTRRPRPTRISIPLTVSENEPETPVTASCTCAEAP